MVVELKNNLQKVRKQKQLSQTDIAKLLGVTRQAISLYEQSKRQLNKSDIDTLTKYFNVSENYLLGAYSKEEIDKSVQDCYKRGINNGNPHTISFLILTKLFNETIDNYFISLGVIPYDIKAIDNLLKPEQINNLDFWVKYLEPLYENVAMQWLITKPNLDASNEDVLSAVNGAMSEFINASATAYTSLDAYRYDYDMDKVVENHYMQKRLKFLEKHEYWDDEEVDEGHWEEYPVYDFKHPHKLDGNRHYIDEIK